MKSLTAIGLAAAILYGGSAIGEERFKGELASPSIDLGDPANSHYFKDDCRGGVPVMAATIVLVNPSADGYPALDRWVIVPTETPDGVPLDTAAAIARFKTTGEAFGQFDSAEYATAYYRFINEPDAAESVAMCAEQ